MGWPRKNEGFRLYRDTQGAYLLVDPETLEYVGEVLVNNNPESPKLATGNTSPAYLHNRKRVQWSDLPEVWQDAFRDWLPDAPENVRGLWKV